MTQKWIIIWKKELYNYKQLIRDINNNLHNGFINQHYRHNQNTFPNINDIVYIQIQGHIIMKSIIINTNLIHTTNDMYEYINFNKNYSKGCVIQIIEIYDNPIKFPFFNRTHWSNITNKLPLV